MLRLLGSDFALAGGIAQAFAASPTVPDDSGSAPMRFEWRREGPADVCAPNCRVWISAVGYITSDTPREFETFAKDPNVRGAVLVLDSDGGSVLGTLALGRAIRALDMSTTIGKTVPLQGAADGGPQATLAPNGKCESMCAFLLLAGSHWYVPRARPVHQIWLGKSSGAGIEHSAEELTVVQRHRASGAIHHRDGRRGRAAGGGAAVSAWEPLYRLSADELQRMSSVPSIRWTRRTSRARHRRGDDVGGHGRPPRRQAGLIGANVLAVDFLTETGIHFSGKCSTRPRWRLCVRPRSDRSRRSRHRTSASSGMARLVVAHRLQHGDVGPLAVRRLAFSFSMRRRFRAAAQLVGFRPDDIARHDRGGGSGRARRLSRHGRSR